MPEFGCDKWRLDDINYEGAVFRCPKVNTNAGLGLYRSVTSFDTAERARIAEEELDCEQCDFNTAKQVHALGRTAIKSKSPYEPNTDGGFRIPRSAHRKTTSQKSLL